MKKKIFIMLTMVAMLICIFAIGVSAEVTTYDDAPARTNIQVSTKDIVVFDDGFSCPTGYVFKDQTRIEDGNSFSSACDFEYIEGKTGKTYTFANVISIDIPQGVTYVGKYAGRNLTTLKSISFPDSVVSFGVSVFENATGLEECVFEHGEDSLFTEFPSTMFYGCKALKALSMPDSITKIKGSHHFVYCTSLTAVYLSKNLTSWESGGGGSKAATFDDCSNVFFVNEPFTYDNIPQKPTVYYFPANLETMANECIFRGCKSLNDVLVFGEKITAAPNTSLFESSPKNTIVFLGDMTSVKPQYWGTIEIYFAHPNDVDATSAGLTTRVGTSSGTAYYCYAEGNTSHLAEKTVIEPAKCEVDAGKYTYCFCGYEISKEPIEGSALSHDYDYLNNENAKLVSIEYTSYLAKGVKTVTCANCGENGEITANALFTCLGYSAPEDGRGGIAIGYTIDNEAIAEYENKTGKILKYGVFAAAKEKLGNNDIFGSDGTVASNVVKAEITSYSFVAFELKIIGFTGEYKDHKLAIGAYVAVTDTETNTTEYSYLQSGTPDTNEKYCFVSYNDIVGKPSQAEDVS